jgi:hypothetical protein
LKEAGARTFDLLVQAIADCQAAGQVRSGDPVVLAVAAWSIVHGLSALLVDGRLKEHVRTPVEAERLAERVTEVLRTGLALRSRRPLRQSARRGSLLSRVLRSFCAARGRRTNRDNTREGKRWEHFESMARPGLSMPTATCRSSGSFATSSD